MSNVKHVQRQRREGVTILTRPPVISDAISWDLPVEAGFPSQATTGLLTSCSCLSVSLLSGQLPVQHAAEAAAPPPPAAGVDWLQPGWGQWWSPEVLDGQGRQGGGRPLRRTGLRKGFWFHYHLVIQHIMQIDLVHCGNNIYKCWVAYSLTKQ